MNMLFRALSISWRLPVWLVSPFTSRHDFHRNPVLGSPLLNRFGLHVMRVLLAHALTGWRWFLLRRLMPHELRDAFHRDGFVVIRDVLPASDFESLQKEVRCAKGSVRQCIQGDTLTQRLLLDREALRGMPHLQAAIHGPRLAPLLRYAAARNARPYEYLQVIRNGSVGGATDPQKMLHEDTFHPTMKAWLFLDDVTVDDGPFTYVPGSHRLTRARLAWEYRRSIVARHLHDGYSEKGSFRHEAGDLQALGLPAPVALALPRNTLVIANTFGIHRRGDARSGSRRSEIWFHSRLNPFVPWPGLGCSLFDGDYHLTKWWWRHQDRVCARRGTRSSWHPISGEQFRAG